MERLQKKNAGFSLIEVLVAITVLAIVITPFLHSFVTAANTNNKAKEIYKATVLAQSVMEGFKTEDVENIALQFNYPQRGFRILPSQLIGGGNVAANVEELCYNGSSYTSAIRYENPAWSGAQGNTPRQIASTYSQDMGENSEFLKDAEGKYYFAMTNVCQDNSLYDVLVRLDASGYRGVDDYNNTALTEIPVTDLEKDAVCIQKDVYTQNAMSELGGVERSALSRTITITVESTPMLSGNYRTKVLAEYAYTTAGNPNTYVKTVTCFDNTETGNDLRSVYLYYFPLYPNAAMSDEIKFINNSAIPVTFYLLKQKQAGITTSTKEDGYCMTLTIRENATADVAHMATAIRTNLMTNLDTGMPVANPSSRQISFNGTHISDVNVLNWNTNLVETVEDRFFDMEVSIYESGAKAAGFPDSMRYTTFEGSRLD